MINTLPYIIAIFFGGCLVLIATVIRSAYMSLPEVEEDTTTTRSPALKLIWPIVRFCTRMAGARLSIDYLEGVSAKLRRVGLDRVVTPEEFVGLRLAAAGIGFVFVWLVIGMLKTQNPLYIYGGLLGGGGLGFLYPIIWINDIRKKQTNEILKSLPVFLDYITLAVEAGLNLTGAINQAVDKGPGGALGAEFKKVLRDLKAGVPRAEALENMSQRLDMLSIKSVISSMVQAERMGANMGPTLRILAEQRRVERFQRAEKQAMEAPVKLLLPLVAFIFPVTFIILMFPIVMKFIQGGLL